MGATPFIIAAAPVVVDRILELPLPAWLVRQSGPGDVDVGLPLEESLSDHLIIVGYGVNGRNLARAAQVAGIHYLILENNPDTVKRERKNGELMGYGDATNPAMLEHAGVEQARILVSSIADPGATRTIIQAAKRLNPGLYVLARTRYVEEVEPLYRVGADDVIPEEFETSVEILVRVLRQYLIPQVEIEEFVGDVRSKGYEMFREMSVDPGTDLQDLGKHIPDSEVATVEVGEESYLVGRTLQEAALRAEYGVTLLAVRRSGEPLPNPGATFRLEAGDQLIVFGSPRQVADAAALARGADSWEQPQ
jgi:CPA2 family monovalent cation:H+ antiporter-2